MELTTLKVVALAVFALIVTIQVFAAIRAVRRVNTKRSAERKLESALFSKLGEPEFREIIEHMQERITASRGDFDPADYAKLLEEITVAAKELKLPEQREVLQGVYQPSELGRERYMRKILENSQRPERRVAAG